MAGWSASHDLNDFGSEWKFREGNVVLHEPTILRGILSFKEINILPAGESHAFLPLPRPATCFVAKESSGEGSARSNFGFLWNRKVRHR